MISSPSTTDVHRPAPAFEVEVARVMQIRGLPRPAAEGAAFDIILVEFLNRTHPDTDPNRCTWCGRPETADATLLPIGVGVRHAWLHPDCWAPWREGRRAQAIAALAEAGVIKPEGDPGA